ncbi:MAG: hypothetical protein ACREEU_02440 [Acetobacteraceae bacterium]
MRKATRDALVVAPGERYGRARVGEKRRILDEFVVVTGFHRQHAMRLLRRGQPGCGSASRPERRLYGDAVREALVVVWEASDRVCGKRLQPLLPVLVEAMERHGHLQLAPQVRSDLLAMSAATMDRALREVRGQAAGRARRRAAPSAAIRRGVPVRCAGAVCRCALSQCPYGDFTSLRSRLAVVKRHPELTAALPHDDCYRDAPLPQVVC